MDKKAKRLFFKTHWKNGWIVRDKRYIGPNDFQYAKEKGLMYSLFRISHDDCTEIRGLYNHISKQKIVNAFLSRNIYNYGIWNGVSLS